MKSRICNSLKGEKNSFQQIETFLNALITKYRLGIYLLLIIIDFHIRRRFPIPPSKSYDTFVDANKARSGKKKKYKS